MTPDHPKVPRAPRQPLTFDVGHLVDYRRPLFRIHTVHGAHPVRWDQYRTYGPLDSGRWDHQPPPARVQPGLGIMYAASTVSTAFAEVFQRSRLILASGDRALSGWLPTTPLRLLDLSSNWPVRNGAGRSLLHAPRSTCRAWARAIHRQAPAGLDGLLADSTLTGDDSRVIVLWENRDWLFPSAPGLSRTLDDSVLAPLVLQAVRATGYRVA